MLNLLHDLKQDKIISELNYRFAKLINSKQQGLGYTEQQQQLAVLLAALVSYQTSQGHSCLRLDSSSAHNFFNLIGKKTQRAYLDELLQKIGYIEPLEWQNILSEHVAFSRNPAQVAPLLFQHQRLYFYRYWQAEYRIAEALQQAAQKTEKNTDSLLNKQILDRFFTTASEIDWQKMAVATALNKSFSLISGGPGTGKTTTVTKLLAVLQLRQLELGLPPLKTALAAPTGKAAARLKESISKNVSILDLPLSIKQQIATTASTLHILLGIRPNHDLPYYHKQNPLPFDLLVIDEASMIDLFIMEKLFNALKPNTRLILLGDKDQLASVEVGCAMSELGELISLGYSEDHCRYLTETTGYPIYATHARLPAICDSLSLLRHSYRFKEDSGIGQLAKQINLKQAANSWQSFANPLFNDIELLSYPMPELFSEKSQWIQQCVKNVVQKATEQYKNYLHLVKQRVIAPESVSVSTIFSAFQKVRFLCALRVGELGVERLNQSIAEALQLARLIEFKQSRENYIGKPILITENAAQLNIFSGDIGIVLPDEQGKLRIYFETVIEGQHLNISPSRVPNYEPAYVMTVHKSQGSEFEHAYLVMPLVNVPVLTKELLYTAVTRARERFTLFSDEKVWKYAVKTEISRQSGLKVQLLSFS